ncbi:MAG: hypothetical protein ACOCUL_00695 [Bacteroidota bacterium]
MYYKYFYKIFFFLFIIIFSCRGQEKPPSWIGLDLLKNVPVSLRAARSKQFLKIIVEPVVMIPLGKKALFNLGMGYANIKKYPVYKNLDYHNEGVYLKGGMGYPIKHSSSGFILTMGLNLAYTIFHESGDFVFESNYFRDYRVKMTSKKVQAHGIEIYLSQILPLTGKWHLNFEERLNFFNMNYEKINDIPVYFVPGFGSIVNNNHITGGFTIKILYKIMNN